MYEPLAHLPEPPADFRQQCRAAASFADLQRLAHYRLEGTHLEQIERARLRLRAEGAVAAFKLGVICNATTDFLPAALSASGLRYGLDVDVVVGDYGQILQEAVNPQSTINRGRCDAVLLALDHRGLALEASPGRSGSDPAAAAIGLVRQTADALKRAHKTTVIYQTVASPARPLFGGMDGVIGGTSRSAVHDFNVALRQLVAQSPGDVMVDVEMLASFVGLRTWHSDAQWNLAKLQFDQSCLPVYADHVMRVVGALRGKSRKCLVLDLDNTCWGGAVGDVGMDGIVLGQGSALGEAFLDVQRTALKLRERGIILAVCSKNDHANAIQPFREHTEMLLREEHISVFQANWVDKASNLKEIAKLLNIGLDSLVLLDDNPAERISVRHAVPSVAVPELPEDPSLYPQVLLNAGYFETTGLTAEDLDRANQYRANALRSQMEASAGDPKAYLSELEMKITFTPFDKRGRTRITQLINKTNQFNLTTRRYTEAEVEAMEADPAKWTMQVRLVDRFGDNGMISCIVCHKTSPETWDIDTWLMSCRVLGRRVEEASMLKVVEHARASGAKWLIGRYIPTAKNNMVQDFYPKLGFEKVGHTDGADVWRLDVATFEVTPTPPMTVVDEFVGRG